MVRRCEWRSSARRFRAQADIGHRLDPRRGDIRRKSPSSPRPLNAGERDEPEGPDQASLDQPHVLPTREPVADDPPWEVLTPAELRAKTPPDPLFESDQNRRLRDIIDVEVRHRTFSSNSALSRAPAEGSPPSSAKAAAGTKTPI